MDKVQFIEVEGRDGEMVQHVIIDRGNGEFTSMPKSVYDEQQAEAEHFTPIVINEAETI